MTKLTRELDQRAESEQKEGSKQKAEGRRQKSEGIRRLCQRKQSNRSGFQLMLIEYRMSIE
jgi:hypothetical protein